MNLIECPHCNKTYSKKGIHTHLQRAHGTPEQKAKFSSGYNGKYDKISQDAKDRKRNDEIHYYKNPLRCKECSKIIIYEKRTENKFCSHSCAATHTNRFRTQKSRNKQSKSLKKSNKKRILSNDLQFQFIEKHCLYCGKFFLDYSKSGRHCSKQCISKTISKSSRKNINCGGKRNSIKFNVIDSFNKPTILESSYELLCSEVLNNLKINWIKPNHLYYIDKVGKKRRYHPDFYLPDYSVYLDPKNDYLISLGLEKFDLVQNQNDVKIFVLSHVQINESYIKGLLGISP